MKTRLIANLSENIGQMPDYLADIEIERMKKQTGNPMWRKDYSDEMYCPDDTDMGVNNPCKRKEDWTNPMNGITYRYCFVTCSTRVQEINDFDFDY